MAESDFSGSCIIGFDSSSSRCGPAAFLRWPNPRSPGSRAKSFHTCQGLGPRRVGRGLALSHPSVLPSGLSNTSAPRLLKFSRLSGRGAGYPAPPPQIPACGLPAPGSCRRSNVIDVQGLNGPFRFDPRIGASCDTPEPALCPGRASASTSSSDWVPSLRPLRHRSSRLCSRVSPVLWTHPTPRLFPDSFAFSTSCRGPGSLLRLRARRGLPGSGAFPSCVMWPQTPAGRRVLA